MNDRTRETAWVDSRYDMCKNGDQLSMSIRDDLSLAKPTHTNDGPCAAPLQQSSPLKFSPSALMNFSILITNTMAATNKHVEIDDDTVALV
jgi:hypothetical protein